MYYRHIYPLKGGKIWFRFLELEIEVERDNGRCSSDALHIYEESSLKLIAEKFSTPPICGYLANSTFAQVGKESVKKVLSKI